MIDLQNAPRLGATNRFAYDFRSSAVGEAHSRLRARMRKAYSVSLEQYGPEHPDTKFFKKNLESLQEQS